MSSDLSDHIIMYFPGIIGRKEYMKSASGVRRSQKSAEVCSAGGLLVVMGNNHMSAAGRREKRLPQNTQERQSVPRTLYIIVLSS